MSAAPNTTGPTPETEADEPPAPDRDDRRNTPAWATLLAALPVLYVLSLGPVILLAKKSGLPQASLRAFYAPLIWLHDHTLLRQPLEWYVGLWGVR